MRCSAKPLYALLLLLALGCQRPMFLQKDNGLNVNGQISAHVLADFQQTQKSPVCKMVVEADGACGQGEIAVIDVDGLLFNARFAGPYASNENPVALFREKLDAAAADPNICALVLRINSPGGGVTAADVMWQQVQAFRATTGRPVVACLMDVAAGGGYYLATSADLIVAHPTSIVGGIGVVFNHYNLEDTMAQFNVMHDPVIAGENINLGSSATLLQDEARAWLQEMASEFHGRFIQVVVESRRRVDQKTPRTFDGRVFTARNALELGLIDEVGYLAHAIQTATDLAGSETARVVMFHRPNDPAHTPLDASPSTTALADLLPVSVPGLERSRLPSFLYLWQLDPTLERFGSPF